MVNPSGKCSYCLFCHKITVLGWNFDGTSISGLQRCTCNACSWGSSTIMAYTDTCIHGKSSFAGTDMISLQGVSSIGHLSACGKSSWSMTTTHSVCSALLSSVLAAVDLVSEPLVLICVLSCNVRPAPGQKCCHFQCFTWYFSQNHPLDRCMSSWCLI